MAHLNHRGPEEKGPKTGRMLGNCKKTDKEKTLSKEYHLGKGLGRKRKGTCNDLGGNRNKSSDLFS
jgi:hypothetical protein